MVTQFNVIDLARQAALDLLVTGTGAYTADTGKSRTVFSRCECRCILRIFAVTSFPPFVAEICYEISSKCGYDNRFSFCRTASPHCAEGLHTTFQSSPAGALFFVRMLFVTCPRDNSHSGGNYDVANEPTRRL